jgi:hypothetical protein
MIIWKSKKNLKHFGGMNMIEGMEEFKKFMNQRIGKVLIIDAYRENGDHMEQALVKMKSFDVEGNKMVIINEGKYFFNVEGLENSYLDPTFNTWFFQKEDIPRYAIYKVEDSPNYYE